MDTRVEFAEVLNKVKTGTPANARDIAVSVANDEQTLLKYLADNDYSQVYRLLHEGDSQMVIGANAGFVPDKKRTEGELGLLLAKKDYPALNAILEDFVVKQGVNNYTDAQQVIESLVDIEALKATNMGYQFNLRFK